MLSKRQRNVALIALCYPSVSTSAAGNGEASSIRSSHHPFEVIVLLLGIRLGGFSKAQSPVLPSLDWTSPSDQTSLQRRRDVIGVSPPEASNRAWIDKHEVTVFGRRATEQGR
jgi:hypothetical protein